jgi:prolipoprotein diacylglyceryltransferase
MLNEGGMSFHGGLIGAVVGTWLANRSLRGPSFATIADLITASMAVVLYRAGLRRTLRSLA